MELQPLDSMMREHLVAKRIAIDSCPQMLGYLGAREPVTRRLVEEIFASGEAHVEDRARRREDVSSGAGRSARS
jgi:bacterioferritin